MSRHLQNLPIGMIVGILCTIILLNEVKPNEESEAEISGGDGYGESVHGT